MPPSRGCQVSRCKEAVETLSDDDYVAAPTNRNPQRSREIMADLRVNGLTRWLAARECDRFHLITPHARRIPAMRKDSCPGERTP